MSTECQPYMRTAVYMVFKCRIMKNYLGKIFLSFFFSISVTIVIYISWPVQLSVNRILKKGFDTIICIFMFFSL